MRFRINDVPKKKFCTQPQDKEFNHAASVMKFDGNTKNFLEITFLAGSNPIPGALTKGFKCLVRGQSQLEGQLQLPSKDVDPQSVPPNDPLCGLASSNRIVGGSRASYDKYPWAVGLVIRKSYALFHINVNFQFHPQRTIVTRDEKGTKIAKEEAGSFAFD